MKKIIEYHSSFLGYEVHVRLMPLEFRREAKSIEALIREQKHAEAHQRIKKAAQVCGEDEDLVRLETFNSFMRDE